MASDGQWREDRPLIGCYLFQVSFSNTAIEMSPANMARMVNIMFPPGPDILAK